MAVASLLISSKTDANLEHGDIITMKKVLNWDGGERAVWEPANRLQGVIVNVEVGNINLANLRGGRTRPLDASGKVFVGYDNGDVENTLRKRRFGVSPQFIKEEYPPLVGTVDWPRLRDPSDSYQPFEDQVFPKSKILRIIIDNATGERLSQTILDKVKDGNG